MALPIVNEILCKRLLRLTFNSSLPVRAIGSSQAPRPRFPSWYVHKKRVLHEDYITAENQNFIREVVQDRLKASAAAKKLQLASESPLAQEVLPAGEWSPKIKRTGVIARKLGTYPMWLNNGTRILTSLLQVVDNHVVKYTPPEEWDPPIKPRAAIRSAGKWGCLLVGAETVDPTLLTKEYYGLFEKSGVAPKRNICRFIISPEAALPPGTPLLASHFKVGDYIDIRGKTIDRGFQGVMTRWGFKGMPASHGVTKTHRRPGNIGGGGEKGRVWPGTKLPGHMGNRWRVIKGIQIMRMNTKYNVIWVKGVAIPGPNNGLCYLYDTILPFRKLQTSPAFPTYMENGDEPEEIYHESVHAFQSPSIVHTE